MTDESYQFVDTYKSFNVMRDSSGSLWVSDKLRHKEFKTWKEVTNWVDDFLQKEKTIIRLSAEVDSLKKQNAMLLARVNYHKFNDHKTITHKDAMSIEDRLKREFKKRESKC